MNDNLFISEFEACTLPAEQFKHRSHLRLAWLYLSKYPLNETIQRTSEGILRYATSLGGAAKFHVTMTHAWVYLVDAARKQSSATDFDAFIDDANWLQNKFLLSEYYSTALLESEEARATFIPPDIKAF